jgi:hypothetical protein
MLDKGARYRTFLLSVWAERSRIPDAPPAWRFALLDPSTGQRRGFASLEALVGTLKQELAIEESNGEE